MPPPLRLHTPKRRHTATSTDPLSIMVATAYALRRCAGDPSTIARIAGLSRPTTDRALRFLARHGFAARNDNDGRWTLLPSANREAA